MANPLPQQVITVANLASFQSSNVASYAQGGAQLAYLQGTVTELDGGEAFYQRIDGDFSSASNPPTLLVDGAGNRWQKTTSVFTVPVSIPNGGTGQSTAYAAFDALTVQAANVAAAATTNIGTATGEFVVVTGSGGPITALGTAAAGVLRFVRFTGAPTLTYNATSLILPGAANITVAAGDFAVFVSLGSGNWQCAAYTELSGGTPGILPVTEGGTGRATLANHGVLVGAATSAITQLSVGATGTVLRGATGADPVFGAVVLTTDVTGVLPVANGGTGLASGTSGGVLGYTASGAIASSGALTANALVLGGGAGATPTPLGSLGTTTTVLHGNADGAPTFAAVALASDVSGTLPNANLNIAAAADVQAQTSTTTLLTPASLAQKVSFRARSAGDQTGIADSTYTKATLATEDWDVGSCYDTSLSRWTPPAGKVVMHFGLAITGTWLAGANVQAALYKNGAIYNFGASPNAASTSQNLCQGVAVDNANGTDYYEVYGFADVSASTASFVAGIPQTYFEGWQQ